MIGVQISKRLLPLLKIRRTSHEPCCYTVNQLYLLADDSYRATLWPFVNIRTVHCSPRLNNDKANVEQQQIIPKPTQPTPNVPIVRPNVSLITVTNQPKVVKRKTLWQRFVRELKHYYNGFGLLFIETKIAFRLLKQVLNGHTLTRRERRQFTRTAADLFRLVPFSVFVIVPFMEFTLPIFLKLFPNMLPSTFKEIDKEKAKLRKQLKVKLEVAKFLQDTLEETALKSQKKRKNEALTTQFIEFMDKIRSTGVQPTTEEIMNFSTLFENKLTLDNLDRQHLDAVCKLIGASTIGPDYYLRFMLHLRLRHLEADDKLIESEGIESLTVEELRAACRDRGMLAHDVSGERLRSQLQQWLDLHLNKRIPSAILLLSRSLYLPENVSQENVLRATIQSLPKAIDNVTFINLAHVSGERVDNTQLIEYVKYEDEIIRKEREEQNRASGFRDVEVKKRKFLAPIFESKTPLDVPQVDILVHKALVLDSEKKDEENIDVEQFRAGLEQLVHRKAQEVQDTVDEIRDLPVHVKLYRDDIKEFATLVANKQLKSVSETRSAKALCKRIDKLVNDLDRTVQKLDDKLSKLKRDIKTKDDSRRDEAILKSDRIQQHKDFLAEKRDMLVSTQEFVNTIRQLQKVSDRAATDDQVWDVIYQLDDNQDGFIQVDEILKTLEIIGSEKVHISKKHLKEIMDIVRKEHKLETKARLINKAK